MRVGNADRSACTGRLRREVATPEATIAKPAYTSRNRARPPSDFANAKPARLPARTTAPVAVNPVKRSMNFAIRSGDLPQRRALIDAERDGDAGEDAFEDRGDVLVAHLRVRRQDQTVLDHGSDEG